MESMLYLKQLVDIGLEKQNNDFDVNDKERPGQPKKFENGELEALLQEDSCQTLKESETLNVDESTVSKRLKAMGMIQKLGNWVSHELRERDCSVVALLIVK